MRLTTPGTPAAIGVLAVSALAIITGIVTTAISPAAAPAAPAAMTGRLSAAALPVAGPPAVSSQAVSSQAVSSQVPDAREACAPPARPLDEQCQLLIGTAAPRTTEGPGTSVSNGVVTEPLTPDDLRAAYGLTAAAKSQGAGETVAVVDAYHDPYIASDLARFRKLAGLGSCSGGGCLTILNENGAGSPLPTGASTGWEDETALDVEMIAAICPNCKIDLFEARSASLTDLGTAENSAAKVARFISNSWVGADFPGESAYDARYFDHPGVAITVASGDDGYAAGYPASSQLVTSVGGTYLNSAGSGRGWSEVAWSGQSTGPGTGTQSGCSAGEPKPAWQSDAGCANRTENDVAAVADAPDGVEFYSSAMDCRGICQAYGTSVATPVIAAVYALAGVPKAGTFPAQYPYLDPAGLYHVTSGSDGTCEAGRQYLCNDSYSLGDGYNGPDGLGTPDGTAAFTAPPGIVVSVVNPGSYDLLGGVTYQLPPVRAYDSAGSPLTFTATGLPAGMSINSATGVISGQTPASADAAVTVTAQDATGAQSMVGFRIVAVPSLASSYRAGQGEVALDFGGMCLDDRHDQAKTGTKVQAWHCLNDRAQRWTFRPSGVPGGSGELLINGRCLDIEGKATTAGSKAVLWPCTGYGNQQWLITGSGGELYNPASGLCLSDPGGSRNGGQADIAACQGTRREAWTLPASPITSGVQGMCADDFGGSKSNRARVAVYSCDGTGPEKFTLGRGGTIQVGGKCLNIAGASSADGTPVQLWTCTGTPNEIFRVSAYGMLQNLASGKCLADPGDSAANGTQLVIEDCYALPGEIWAVS